MMYRPLSSGLLKMQSSLPIMVWSGGWDETGALKIAASPWWSCRRTMTSEVLLIALLSYFLQIGIDLK
jgi:hypothetical protein